MSGDANLPDHIDDVVRAVAAVHKEHEQRATLLQRLAERITAVLGSPITTVVIVLAIAGWIAMNLFGARIGLTPPDPELKHIELAGTMAAVLIAILILATQRRENELEEQRSQLTLQFALLGEQKTAKLIELVEELRRDLPQVADRPDPVSSEMGKPADPRTVLDALRGNDPATEGVAKSD